MLLYDVAAAAILAFARLGKSPLNPESFENNQTLKEDHNDSGGCYRTAGRWPKTKSMKSFLITTGLRHFYEPAKMTIFLPIARATPLLYACWRFFTNLLQGSGD
jgi:hypothetical protein